jgi:toxic protein SymE
MSHLKFIHIGGKYRKRKWDSILVPEIRLNGIWLETLGFSIGDIIEITYEKDSIKISKTNNNI